MSDFPMIMGRLTNQPLLVTPDYLASSLQYLSSRMDAPIHIGDQPVAQVIASPDHLRTDMVAPYSSRIDRDRRSIEDGVATISVTGSLAAKPGRMVGMSSSLRDYKTIAADMRAALNDERVGAIALYVDSPGGEGSGCFALCDQLYKMRGRKPIWAIVDEGAMSAGFAIASAADRIVGPDTSLVGSVGVVTAHVSMQQRLQNEGIKVTWIYAGAHKVDGNGTEDLSDGARSEITARINSMYQSFVSMVAENRQIQAKEVRGTEARIFEAREAMQVGFLDEVMSVDDAFAALRELSSGASRTNGAQLASATTGNTMAGSDGAPQGEEKLHTGSELQGAEKAARDAGAEEGAKAERARCAAIVGMEEAQLSDAHRGVAAECVALGLSPEQAKSMLSRVPAPAKAEESAGEKPADAEAPIGVRDSALDAAMAGSKEENDEVDATPASGDDADLQAAIASAEQFRAESGAHFNFAKTGAAKE